MINEIAKLEKEIDQRKAKIKSIKDGSRSEMLNTIVEAREEYREAASKLNGLVAEYQKMYPTAIPFTYEAASKLNGLIAEYQKMQPTAIPFTYPDFLRGTKFQP
jgi:uncharacterized coiled-coil DUF342 family protein